MLASGVRRRGSAGAGGGVLIMARYYDIEFAVELPRSITIRARDAVEARRAALDIIDEAVKGVMDFLGVDEGTWKGPVCIADLHLADTWGHVPRMRDDSVGIYDATAAAEGGRADG